MAEVIGVVASVITFGTVVVQITSSVNKLKDCWEQIRDAPEDLKWLIRDIELFSIILSEAESDWERGPVSFGVPKSASAEQSLKLCKEASEQLELLVREFQQDTSPSSRLKRSYAAVKMVLQKKKVEKYRLRLKNVVGLLMLSQQCYTRALVQAQHQVITQRMPREFPQSMHSVSGGAMGFTAESDSTTPNNVSWVNRRKPSRIQNTNFSWRLEMPTCIANRALELAGLRVPDGWKFAFRTYNIISDNSKAVECVGMGDIQGLQELFSLRRATPFDRIDKNGLSLLHYACGSESDKMLKFLLDQGADPSIDGHFSHLRRIPLLAALVGFGNIRITPLLPSLRLLLPHLDSEVYETPEETVNGLLSNFQGTASEFLFLQQECCPKYFDMPQSARVMVAALISFGPLDAVHTPELVLTALGKRPSLIPKTDLESLADSKSWAHHAATTLSHSIAYKIGMNLANLSASEYWRPGYSGSKTVLESRNEEYNTVMDLYQSWKNIFIELLDAGVDIHKVIGHSTPFNILLATYFDDFGRGGDTQFYDSALKMWLRDLKIVGVDLRDFGEREEELFRSGVSNKDLSWCRWCPGTTRLIGFTYGSSPDDWHLWISERSDSFAGDFWSLVKRQEEVMPGAWPDDPPYKM